MDNNQGFVVYENNKFFKNKKHFITLISLLLVIVTFISVFTYKYNSATKKAENIVAVYLSSNYKDYPLSFLSYDKIYSTTKFKKFGCTVELSGSVNVAYSNYKPAKRQFYAKVYVGFFDNSKISKIIINREKVYP